MIYLGTLVGSQFQALEGGLAIALPCPADDPDADGHALLVVGYWTLTEADVATFSAAGMTVAVGDTLYRVQNSWSETWDANGECWASAAWLRACGELHPLVPAKAA